MVQMDELMDAYLFVSAAYAGEAEAWVDRETGHIYRRWMEAPDLAEDLPEDVEHSDRYVPVPGKYDLDLGKGLALRFAHEYLPPADVDAVYSFFRREGAYRRFKDLLDRRGLLERWHAFDDEQTLQALREWCAERGLAVEE